MTEQEEEIRRLTLELQQLTIERERIERQERRVSEQLNNINIRRNAAQREARRASRRFHRPAPYSNLNEVQNRVDLDGVQLTVGDRVRFISQGVQTSDTGSILGFGRRFVKCVDKNRHRINKEPHNLIKLTNSNDNDREQ